MPRVTRPLILLSGPLCSGKTTLAVQLRDRVGAHVVSARDLLRQLGASEGRESLQEVGAQLEAATGGAWLAQAAADVIRKDPTQIVVVDSVRTANQLEHLRRISNRSVLFYLTASPPALHRRFDRRIAQGVLDSISYAHATAHSTEGAVAAIASSADDLIDTTGVRRSKVFERVKRFLESHGGTD